MRGFGAGTGVCMEVVMGSSWEWMEFWIVNSMVLFFLLQEYPFWIVAVYANAHLWK